MWRLCIWSSRQYDLEPCRANSCTLGRVKQLPQHPGQDTQAGTPSPTYQLYQQACAALLLLHLPTWPPACPPPAHRRHALLRHRHQQRPRVGVGGVRHGVAAIEALDGQLRLAPALVPAATGRRRRGQAGLTVQSGVGCVGGGVQSSGAPRPLEQDIARRSAASDALLWHAEPRGGGPHFNRLRPAGPSHSPNVGRALGLVRLLVACDQDLDNLQAE